jgi:cell shape-determining protein MreC
MEVDYKKIAGQYKAENFLIVSENEKLLSPVQKSFEISLLLTEMIGETLLFAAEKGHNAKITERLSRLQKISEFVTSFDNVSFELFRYRQHLKVNAYQYGKVKEENEILKARLAKYEKWEKDNEPNH